MEGTQEDLNWKRFLIIPLIVLLAFLVILVIKVSIHCNATIAHETLLGTYEEQIEFNYLQGALEGVEPTNMTCYLDDPSYAWKLWK